MPSRGESGPQLRPSVADLFRPGELDSRRQRERERENKPLGLNLPRPREYRREHE